MTKTLNVKAIQSTKHKIKNGVLSFEFWILDLFRVSGLGFRVSRALRGRGFTLIEILLSLAVLAAIAGVIVSGLSSFRRSADLNRAQDAVVAQLRDARRQSIESKEASQWGVHIENTQTTLFKGDTFSAGAPDNKVFILPGTVTISTISLEGGGSDAVFQRISGETDQAGNLTLTLGSSTKVITIHLSGLVEMQ